MLRWELEKRITELPKKEIRIFKPGSGKEVFQWSRDFYMPIKDLNEIILRNVHAEFKVW